MSDFPKIIAINENTVIVYLSDQISSQMPALIAKKINAVKTRLGYCLIDLTPSYTSVLISFNPQMVSMDSMIESLAGILKQIEETQESSRSKCIEVPVYYSTQTGLDLEQTASTLGMSIERLIELHSAPKYSVFALGFLPGFAFLGIVDEAIVLPRLSTPRLKVPPGSVAIAEKQTAAYPAQTPGGWRILGRTPMCLFDIKRNPPQPYQIGDTVKFNPITRSEFLQLGGDL